jgi:hypothetical protein
MAYRPRPAAHKRSRRWTADEARLALAELRSSGLSVAAFARSSGIHVQRLHSWKKKLSKSAKTATPAFIEVPHRAAATIEIVLPSGIVIRVAETVDAEAVRRIVGAIAGDALC